MESWPGMAINNTNTNKKRIKNETNRYVFGKLRAAKVFAQDLAEAIKNETAFPRICEDKYLDLE